MIGILAAVSPCPLATNVTAMAYISRKITDRRYAVTSGILYTLGRMTSYFALGVLVILAEVKISGISLLLQDVGERFLGPLLIIVGFILLDIVKLPLLHSGGRLASIAERVANWGVLGGFLLGVVFALAFCPYSVVLFFGIVVPLALKSTAGITLPAAYAAGTGLPVLVFGVLLSVGTKKVFQWLNQVTAAERVVRKIAALAFVAVGVYYVALWIRS